jgi:hypothetical protein
MRVMTPHLNTLDLMLRQSHPLAEGVGLRGGAKGCDSQAMKPEGLLIVLEPMLVISIVWILESLFQNDLQFGRHCLSELHQVSVTFDIQVGFSDCKCFLFWLHSSDGNTAHAAVDEPLQHGF